MTRRERPDLGWHAAGWGILRRWWERRHPRADEWDDDAPVGEGTPETPGPAPRRWWHTARLVALWCAGSVLVVQILRPAPWLLAVAVGAAGALLIEVHQRRTREAAHLAHELERERRTVTARAVREARQRQNRTVHQVAQDERDEAARRDREARRAANRQAHWQEYPYAD